MSSSSALVNPLDPNVELSGNAQIDSEESDFLKLINDYRLQNGIGSLKISLALTRAADWLSYDMAEKNYFSHTDSLGRDSGTRQMAFGYSNAGAWGENIAGGGIKASQAFTQWKNSPGHNANMLNPNFKVIGIGRATTKALWTTDFGGRLD